MRLRLWLKEPKHTRWALGYCRLVYRCYLDIGPLEVSWPRGAPMHLALIPAAFGALVTLGAVLA